MFIVKCRNKVKRLMESIVLFLLLCFLGIFVANGAATKKDFYGILAFVIITILIGAYAFFKKGGEEIFNEIHVNKETMIVKRFLHHGDTIYPNDVERYTVFRKKVNKGLPRECVQIYYGKGFIELYEDNVCNFELLVDYLRRNVGREKEFDKC